MRVVHVVPLVVALVVHGGVVGRCVGGVAVGVVARDAVDLAHMLLQRAVVAEDGSAMRERAIAHKEATRLRCCDGLGGSGREALALLGGDGSALCCHCLIGDVGTIYTRIWFGGTCWWR